MTPIVNQILSWEKELEIREQKSRKTWDDGKISSSGYPAVQRISHRPGIAWLSRISRPNQRECVQAACD